MLAARVKIRCDSHLRRGVRVAYDAPALTGNDALRA